MISENALIDRTQTNWPWVTRRALTAFCILAFAIAWPFSAHSGHAPSDYGAVYQVAEAEAADKEHAESELLTFPLPPIVVRIRQSGEPQMKVVAFKADLVFDEVDPGRIDASIDVADQLVPRIVDSVITGLEGRQIEAASMSETVNRLVIERVNLVLNPYGVTVKSLNVRYLGPI